MKLILGIVITVPLLLLGTIWYIGLSKNEVATKTQVVEKAYPESTDIAPTNQEIFKIWSSISGEQYDKNYVSNI